MSETGESPTPNLSGHYDTESQKLANERARLELQERRLEQERTMGKFDIHPEGFVPPDGELTYEQYLAQRPREGVVRDELNGGYREAHTGKYASEEGYLSAQEVSLDEKVTPRTSLDDLGLVALAKEAAAAKRRNDIADEKEIEKVVRARIEQQARSEKSGNLTVTDVETAVEQEMQTFYDRVARLGAAQTPPDAAPSSDATEATEPVSETDRASGSGDSVVSEEGSSPDVANKVEVVDVNDIVTTTTGNGDTGITENVSREQFGEEFDTLTSPFGLGKWAKEGLEGQANSDTTRADTDTEVVPADDEPASRSDEVDVESSDEQEEGEDERQSSWWERNKKFFGIDYYAAQWTMMLQRSRESGQVSEDMTQEQVNEVLERKRRNQLLGMITVAVATGLVAYVAMKGGTVDGNAVAGGVSPDTIPDVTPGITDQLPGVESVGEVPLGPELSVEALNPGYEIPSGTGGEALFQRLGLEPRGWYQYQDDLLTRFPDSFYRMDSGNVGIAQSGWLPNEVQTYIESLR